jgi:hypothetical protein
MKQSSVEKKKVYHNSKVTMKAYAMDVLLK